MKEPQPVAPPGQQQPDPGTPTPRSWPSWLLNALMLLFPLLVGGVVGFYGAVSGVRGEVYGRLDDYNKRLLIVEADIRGLRQSSDVQSQIRELLRLQIREEESRLIGEIRKAIEDVMRRR